MVWSSVLGCGDEYAVVIGGGVISEGTPPVGEVSTLVMLLVVEDGVALPLCGVRVFVAVCIRFNPSPSSTSI